MIDGINEYDTLLYKFSNLKLHAIEGHGSHSLLLPSLLAKIANL
jgi:hypothetical protein